MKLTKKEWKLILVSLEGGRLEAGAMAEEKQSGFIDIPLQEELEKPYKELMAKIKTKGLRESMRAYKELMAKIKTKGLHKNRH